MTYSWEARFWSKVLKTETCWLWQGTIDRNGYGHFTIGKVIGGTLMTEQYLAHRTAFFLYHGREAVPCALHTRDCPYRHCVRDIHLYEGTYSDNMADRKAVGKNEGGRPSKGPDPRRRAIRR